MPRYFHYQAYGFSIRSELELPELHPATSGDELRVEWVGMLPEHTLPKGSSSGPFDVRANDHEAYLAIPNLTRFYAAGGKNILIEANENADQRAIQLNVVTAMLPFLLMQRGMLLIHGSAVSLNGHAYAFVGPSGFGKSSTAASLCAAGARLLVDDVVALEFSGDRPTLCPGFPHLKLHLSMSETVSVPGAVPREIHPAEEKRGLALTECFSPERHPLAGMYFLNLGEETRIDHLTASETMRALSCNPYINGLTPNAHRFLACAQLAKQVDGYRLTRSDSMDDLPRFTDTLIRHLNGQGG